MANAYPIPAEPICVEQEIKRSRFITDIGHAESKEEALAFIAQVKAREPEARHHCWAYIAGHPVSSIERACFDAGEPAGTAGKPMLNVLQHKGIGEIVVVVSRYFGGIKLGAGGLVRAYSSSAQQAIDALPLSQRIETFTAEVRLPFPLESTMRRLLDSMGISITDTRYENDVLFIVEIECGREDEVEQSIINSSRGEASFSIPEG